jgi:protein-disulfide isomerase
MRMRRSSLLGAATAPMLALALALGGCAQKSDVEAVQATQKEILAKLEKIEKDQATILARVQAQPAAARPQADPGQVHEIPIASSYVRGPKDAPVTITMFSDFQCPFCAQATPIVDEVLKAYPKDVNFVMKQFPLKQIHPQAEPAARAALAAGKQGKFWEMHDELYKNSRTLSPETFKRLAEELGLDVQKFQADMDSEALKKQVDEEFTLGQKVNVRGTPTFFINGKLALNRSVDGFKAQIEEELKKKKG